MPSIEKRSTELNAILEVNDHASEDAKRLDQLLASRNGTLHELPIVIRHQIEAGGIATSFGSEHMS